MKVISVKYKTSSTEVKAIDCFVDSGYLQGPGGSLPDVDVDFQSDRRQEVKSILNAVITMMVNNVCFLPEPLRL